MASGDSEKWTPPESDSKEVDEQNAQVAKNEVRLVLVGRSGDGKSSTANMISGSDHFNVKISPKSVTYETTAFSFVRGDKKYIVIDTPGVFDTNPDPNFAKTEIPKCVTLVGEGPHAIVYVCSLRSRMNKNLNESLLEIVEIFGDRIFQHLIILFTSADAFKENRKRKFDNYIDEMPPFFKKVLDRCQGRVIAFNNEAGQDEASKQVDDFFILLDNMIESRNGAYYSNDMLKEAATFMRQVMNIERKSMKYTYELLQREIEKEGPAFKAFCNGGIMKRWFARLKAGVCVIL